MYEKAYHASGDERKGETRISAAPLALVPCPQLLPSFPSTDRERQIEQLTAEIKNGSYHRPADAIAERWLERLMVRRLVVT